MRKQVQIEVTEYFCDCCGVKLKHPTYINNTTGANDGNINYKLGFDLCDLCLEKIHAEYEYDIILFEQALERVKTTIPKAKAQTDDLKLKF